MGSHTSDEFSSQNCRAIKKGLNCSKKAAGFERQINGRLETNISSTVVIIEKRALVRDLLVDCISRAIDQSTVAVESIEEFSGLAADIDVALVIVSFAGRPESQENQQLIRQVAETMPKVPSVLISDCEDFQQIVAVLQAGTRGFISTNMSFHLAMEAVRLVQAGGHFLPASSVLSLEWSDASRFWGDSQKPLSDMLTLRQSAIINALRQGKANKIIAYELNLRESTVKVHVRNIMKKLKAKNRTEVAYIANQLIAKHAS